MKNPPRWERGARQARGLDTSRLPKRSPIGLIAATAVAALFIGGFVYVVEQVSREAAAKDASAKEMGFKDHADLDAARARGITDPAAWREILAADKAKREQEEQARAASQRIATAAIAEMKRSPTERMSISKQSWQKGGFDSIGLMTITIANKNEYPVKDIRISCSFYGKSGTQLNERSHVIFDVIPPGGSKSFSKVNIGFINSQAERGGCDLIGADRG